MGAVGGGAAVGAGGAVGGAAVGGAAVGGETVGCAKSMNRFHFMRIDVNMQDPLQVC